MERMVRMENQDPMELQVIKDLQGKQVIKDQLDTQELMERMVKMEPQVIWDQLDIPVHQERWPRWILRSSRTTR